MKITTPKKKITKTPSPAAIFAPAQELSKITTLDELELFVIRHVITTAGEWPEKKYTAPDDSMMIGEKSRAMSYEEAAEYFRKRNVGLSLFLHQAYKWECRLILKDPKRLAMVQLKRAGREVKRERGLKEGWIDSAYKEHPLAEGKRKQIRDNKKNAPKGGRAPKYAEATIIEAFMEYANRHKDAGHSMPKLNDALRHITTNRADNPEEYINLSFVQLERRTRKIAKAENITPPQWWESLWQQAKVIR
jgi:hypothetical protein